MAAQPLFLGWDPEAEASADPNIDDIDLDRLFDDEVLPVTIAKELAKSSSAATILPNPSTANSVGSLNKQDLAVGASGSDSNEDEDDAARDRIRRVYAKLDHERLCGPKGLRTLRFQTRSFRPRSLHRRKKYSQPTTSSSELLRDLDTILSTYRLWAHQCLPKVAFRDFERTASKLCRSRRMHQYVAQLKEDEQRQRTQEDDLARAVSSEEEEEVTSDRVALPLEPLDQTSRYVDGIPDSMGPDNSLPLPQNLKDDTSSLQAQVERTEVEDDEDEEEMEALRMVEK